MAAAEQRSSTSGSGPLEQRRPGNGVSAKVAEYSWSSLRPHQRRDVMTMISVSRHKARQQKVLFIALLTVAIVALIATILWFGVIR